MTTPPSTQPDAAEAARAHWREHAACLDLDPEIFFPVGIRSPAPRQARMARRTCRSCPVIADCLEWALATAQGPGIWGGLNEIERGARLRERVEVGEPAERI